VAQHPATRELAKELLLQIVGFSPKYLRREDIPAADLAKEREIHTEILRKEGKPKFYFDPLFIATPIVSGGIVYLNTTDGQLLALDEATGAELYVQEFGRPFTASPAVSGNALFLASYNGTVWGLVSTAP